MYPGTKFNWIDLTTLTIQEPESVDDSPLFLQAFACDKGPEKMTIVKGEDFAKIYGTQSFSKYGQAGIQAQNIINAGGRLLAKRVVADDSLLGYTILTVTVGLSDGKATLTWKKDPVDNAEPGEDNTFKTFKEVVEYAKATLETEDTFPVMVIADNGRGVSQKSFRITPDYATSKSFGNVFYTISSIEGTKITEQQPMTLDTEVILNDIAYRLDTTTMVQLDTLTIESEYDKLLEKIASTVAEHDDFKDLTEDQRKEKIRKNDLLFGYSTKGGTLSWLQCSSDSLKFNDSTGIKLQFGDNGSYDTEVDPDTNELIPPKDTEAYCAALESFFDGTEITADGTRWIYDLDEFKIAAVVDANYPFIVKKAIADLANMREDFVYFRDYGLGLTTFAQIKAIHDGVDETEESSDPEAPTKVNERCIFDPSSWFIMDYVTSYKILDPIEKKQIDVTMTYDLAACLVNHIARSANAPVAGIANGFVLPSAIKGTISFTPQIQRVWDTDNPYDEDGYKQFKDDNQKQAMDDLHVNYAIFQDNDCVVQGTYSAHKKETQMIYGNNILAIQEVLRAVRTACPRIRYTLSTGQDLENYEKDVNAVLEKFQSNFSILNFIYTADPIMTKQKIFKASIEFAFLNWAQSEIFDIYAIDND